MSMLSLAGILSQSTGNWYDGAIAAYQPKGAASLAASYINLANPGTFDASPGVAPTWDAVNGWTFDGLAQYLTTGVTPSDGWSALVQFSDAADVLQTIFGMYVSSGGSAAFLIALKHPNAGGGVLFGNGDKADIQGSLPNQLSGNLAIAGKSGYRNGVFSTAISPGTMNTPIPMVIGALNTSGIFQYFSGKIQAFAIYDTTLSAPEVATVSAAMATL